MNSREKPSYGRLATWEEMDAAMAEGVRRALIVHKALGEPIWVMRDGELVKIPAEEIKVSSEPVKGAPPFRGGSSEPAG
jgi:hypothetical protein